MTSCPRAATNVIARSMRALFRSKVMCAGTHSKGARSLTSAARTGSALDVLIDKFLLGGEQRGVPLAVGFVVNREGKREGETC